MSPIEEVLIVGAGAMGREIALQCAMAGYRVGLYEPDADALRRARAIVDVLARDVAPARGLDPRAVSARIFASADLAEAVATADLVSESAPEDLELKRAVFAELGRSAPDHTIFTTNSSSLTPSMMADATGRPDRFLALHFHKTVWVSNVVDVMAHPGTAPRVTDHVTAFARTIGQTPIVLRREVSGYVFNTMLQAYITAALQLWGDGVATVEDIDRAWMIAERAEHGPFGVMDFVGIDTVRDIIRTRGRLNGDASFEHAAERLTREMIDHGRLGVKSGEGFYRYPEPAFARPGFLAGDGGEADHDIA